MIPMDIKNYRAHRESTIGWCVMGIVCLVLLLAWMGERDREAHVEIVRKASQAQCDNGGAK